MVVCEMLGYTRVKEVTTGNKFNSAQSGKKIVKYLKIQEYLGHDEKLLS